MNRLVFVTDKDNIIKRLDETFKIVVVTPNSSEVGKGNYQVLIMDSRSEDDMRTEIRNIYERKGINTGI